MNNIAAKYRKDTIAEEAALVTAFLPSPLGDLKITVSNDWLHSILFTPTGNDAAINNEQLVDDYINHPLLAECCKQLNEYFSGKRKLFDLPLQQPGTAFQQKVWASLLTIPYGSTISYLTLSKRIGNTKAIRAAGTANGKNSLAIIVPCHRVIGSNGTLVGYAGELWRKQWLLEHEGKFGGKQGVLF